jgi:ATP-binding cassette subfamily C protein CydD
LTAVKDAAGAPADQRAMTTAAISMDGAKARGAWLRRVAGRGGAAGLLLLLDTGMAIVFAAALAAGVSAVPDGAAAVAPWALLAVAAGLGRGLLGLGAVRAGAAAAAVAKRQARGRVIESALHRDPGQPIDSMSVASQAVDGVEALDGWSRALWLPAARRRWRR